MQLYWKQEHESEGEYILQYHFVDEIFPPYKCTHGPGEDPFEAVMCAVGAASQISCCLWKILFLIQNITRKSLQELLSKDLLKALHCEEITYQIFEIEASIQKR